MLSTAVVLVLCVSLVREASAQTFKRLGACPSLGCVFPPDQTDFLPGQYFDIRLEVHAPVDGSEATRDGEPDRQFTFCIQRNQARCVDVAKFFGVDDPKLETWSFKCIVTLENQTFILTVILPATSKTYLLKTLAKRLRSTLPPRRIVR